MINHILGVSVDIMFYGLTLKCGQVSCQTKPDLSTHSHIACATNLLLSVKAVLTRHILLKVRRLTFCVVLLCN